MRDWFLGLVSGLIGAAFGVLLYMLWDRWKEKHATRERNRALQEIIEADLSTNLGRIRHNLNALKQELGTLPKRMAIVEPLPLLRMGFWEILRLEPSSNFFTVKDKGALHNLYDLTEGINERLRAREQFKNNNGAMSNFHSNMNIHDEELIKALGKLNDAVEALPGNRESQALSTPAA